MGIMELLKQLTQQNLKTILTFLFLELGHCCPFSIKTWEGFESVVKSCKKNNYLFIFLRNLNPLSKKYDFVDIKSCRESTNDTSYIFCISQAWLFQEANKLFKHIRCVSIFIVLHIALLLLNIVCKLIYESYRIGCEAHPTFRSVVQIAIEVERNELLCMVYPCVFNSSLNLGFSSGCKIQHLSHVWPIPVRSMLS